MRIAGLAIFSVAMSVMLFNPALNNRIKRITCSFSRSLPAFILCAEGPQMKVLTGCLWTRKKKHTRIFSLGWQVKVSGRLLDAALTPLPLSLSYIELSPTIGTKAKLIIATLVRRLSRAPVPWRLGNTLL